MTADGSIGRGMDHIGITVPDIEAATAFLEEAFGAEVIYDLTAPDPHSPLGDEVIDALGIRPDARWIRCRMIHLGEGPGIELFEYADPGQREPHTASDLGIQHFAIYVDDIEAAQQRVIAAGGRSLRGPSDCRGFEAGEGNKWLYTVAPWGSLIELITYPSKQPYEDETDLRRWRPAQRHQAPHRAAAGE